MPSLVGLSPTSPIGRAATDNPYQKGREFSSKPNSTIDGLSFYVDTRVPNKIFGYWIKLMLFLTRR